MTIRKQLAGPMRIHLGLSEAEVTTRAIELLDIVGIPKAADRLDDYPHQFSGGMRQRVMIAMALSCNPRILIADEPTTALDVTIQAQIIDLVQRIQRQLNMAVIWITHDMGIIAELADRVIVMYAGFIVEEADVHEIFHLPLHPYTIGLMGSLPSVAHDLDRLANLEGRPPSLLKAAEHCPFAPRCTYSIDRCWEENPQLLPVTPGHRVACWVDVLETQERHHP